MRSKPKPLSPGPQHLLDAIKELGGKATTKQIKDWHIQRGYCYKPREFKTPYQRGLIKKQGDYIRITKDAE